ncbi:MAG: secretin N-terminal domain-containing protein [Chthoniobacterales bacterium]
MIFSLRIFPIHAVVAAIAMTAFSVAAQQVENPNELVELQFPNNPVQDVLDYYQRLTGKQLIRDSNLSGSALTITAPGRITKSEAIAMIESALTLNNYQLVDVDANTVKILGTTKSARSESVQLYTSPEQLPVTDQIVSYFMPFRYLKADEAKTLFEQYVTVRPVQGSIVAVPSVNALLITENVPLVRRLIALQRVIDVQGSRSVTEFFTLTRADAERVAEILEKVFEQDAQGTGATPQPQRVERRTPDGQVEAVPDADVAQAFATALPLKIKIVPDLRTNRVMVVAPETQMAYIREIVNTLDQAVGAEAPLLYVLRFANAGEVLPVLANLLAEPDAESQESADLPDGAGQGSFNNDSGGGGGDFSGSGGGVGSKPDLLREPADNTAPKSIVVGKTKIIADQSSNQIIVYGPPESQLRAESLLTMLDQRPVQIYLAVVIGQLTLGDGVTFGVDYLMRFGDVRILGQGGTAGIGNLLANRNASIDILPDTDDLVNTAVGAATRALPVVSGLSVFGSIADSVDIFAQALSETNHFEVISRPVVYTLNNKKAVISSGQQVPVPTSSLTSLDSSVNNSTAVQSNVDFKDVVLKLEVIPLVNSPNEVTLKIAQQNDNVQGFTPIGGNDVPIIATQELRTTVTVPNRHTIILGGLITEEDTFTKSGIPYLKDIPYVGSLFGTTRKDKDRRELIVMIQPFIINGPGDVEAVQHIERANLNFDAGLFDSPAPIEVRKGVLPESPFGERYLGPVPDLLP